jgi:hypothetical protein
MKGLKNLRYSVEQGVIVEEVVEEVPVVEEPVVQSVELLDGEMIEVASEVVEKKKK